jgi:hypothetical protein
MRQMGGKIKKYNQQITNKTEKTVERLSKWETKIKKLVEKADPEAAKRLFGNNQLTFNTLLQKIREGKGIAEGYTAKYDAYTDRLQSSIKYLGEEKRKVDNQYLQRAEQASRDLKNLSSTVAGSEYLQDLIRERKKQLMNEAVKYIGKSRYLTKINKEGYYYTEALRNYKEVFNDSKKTEELVIKALQGIPAFRDFASQNSPLSGLFTSSSSFPVTLGSVPIVNGLAPRSSVQQFIAASMPSVNPSSVMQQIQQQASGITSNLEDKKKEESKGGEDFIPNSQRSKPFWKRLEATTDLQFGRSVNYLPVTVNIGANLGYRLNDRSSIGIGMSYMLGLGNGWQHIKLSNEGIGFRTYLRWMLNKGWDMQGGSEWNYMASFKNINELKNANPWQRSALLGIGKNYRVGKKIKGSIRLFYDFLNRKNEPQTHPFIFRFGYGF